MFCRTTNTFHNFTIKRKEKQILNALLLNLLKISLKTNVTAVKHVLALLQGFGRGFLNTLRAKCFILDTFATN